ncbi:murein biosynthesis integral membrane protein MurJ [Marinomonas sp. PE14-40]|uniref:murein biosynthesis integral membrane protein MurJ n=1 Tax=Marinomonas sp. PE14-40 TaxID=3060621 RepID=UPI003F677365
MESPKLEDKSGSKVAKKRPSLLRSGVLVSICTMLSRVLGLVRDAALAFVLGASGSADAFYVAFKIPNFLRRLFAEGAFAQAFVPVLSDYKVNQGQTAVRELVSAVSGSLGLVLLLVSALFMAFSPWVVYIFAPGFADNTEQLALASDLLTITFPYLMFISLTALAGGILNSHDEYAIPAITPIFLNLSLIIATVFFANDALQKETAIAWGVFAAGALQLAFQLPFLAKLNLLPMPSLGFSHPGVKRIFKLMLPALFGVSVSQINLLLDTILASFLQTGSITWLYLSDRLYELPLGIFAIAISTVILPSLSRSFAGEESERFTSTLDWGLRTVLLIAVPSSLALYLLAEPLIATIFYRGALTVHDVSMAAVSLQAYSVGLVFMMLIKVLAPAYYARQDTKTPVKIGIIAMVANMAFNLILVGPFGHVGLAMATTLSAALNAFLLWHGLRKRSLHQFNSDWIKPCFAILLGVSCLAGLLLWHNALAVDWTQLPDLERVWRIALVVIVGVLVYFAGLFLGGFRPRMLKA